MTKQVHIFSILIFYTSFIHSMVFDNRYLPLIQKPFISVPDHPSHLRTGLFFITSKRAFGTVFSEQEIGIPELFGNFDQGDLGRSMSAAGLTNPLPFVWQTGTFPWAMDGKIQGEGFDFSGQLAISNYFDVGFSLIAMRINSRMEFLLKSADSNVALDSEDTLLLDDIRREMFTILGLSCGFAQQVGLGDIDTYLRASWACEYQYKFRAIEAGLRVGALWPTGETKLLSNPATIPFGGNGHWGMYINGDAEFELKEDWKLGFWLRVIQRFSRTCNQRMPVAKTQIVEEKVVYLASEPEFFGVVIGRARVTPGTTIAFFPYFYVENIREGLGMGIQYTLVHHFKDRWIDERANKTVVVNLNQNESKSDWSSEYVTLNIFYDFGKVKADRGFSPIAYLHWDIPVNFIIGRAVPKTFKVEIGVEFAF